MTRIVILDKKVNIKVMNKIILPNMMEIMIIMIDLDLN